MKKDKNIFGAIFDWDGVIIDSSRHHEESWERLAREEGKPLPPGHFKRGFGMKNEKIIPGILSWTDDSGEISRISLRKEELYRDIIKEWGLAPLPGVRTFLEMLCEEGIPCVIGSSTHRLNITTGLSLLGFGDFFSGLVTAEDVQSGKPDPEVFLLAADKLQLHPSMCLVFEDALVGITAAHAGGMKVVAVATTHSPGDLFQANLVVSRLDETDLATLHGLFSI